MEGADWERSLTNLMFRKLIVELDGRYVNVAVKASGEDSEGASTGVSDDDILTSYLERMRLMRYQVERLKIRAEE